MSTPDFDTDQLNRVIAINARWVAERNDLLLAGASALTLDELSAQLDAHLDKLRAALDAARTAAAEAKATELAEAAHTGVIREGAPVKAPRGVTYLANNK